MIPACDHTGTPLHFHSSTTSGSACLTSVRIRASVSPRQSLSSWILASISREGETPPVAFFEPLFVLFMVVAAFSIRAGSELAARVPVVGFRALGGFAHLEDIGRPVAELVRNVAHCSHHDPHDLPDVGGAGLDGNLQSVLAGLESLQLGHSQE